MGLPHPIVEFLGLFVGVDPDDYPSADEDALREYARQYDAIAADLRTSVGTPCRTAAEKLPQIWSGEPGTALGAQIGKYGSDAQSGGVESIAQAAEEVANYLRDQADTVFRAKVMFWAQVAIGLAMYAVPAGKLISLGMRSVLANGLKNFLKRKFEQIIGLSVAALRARAGKALALTPVKVFQATALVAANGLGPNTVAQVAGIVTDQSRHGGQDAQGNYEHETGWNWSETGTNAAITAAAVPIAALAGLGLAGVGKAAAARMPALAQKVPAVVARQLAGGATMAVTMPTATMIGTGHVPTAREAWTEAWRAGVMGTAVPVPRSHAPVAPAGEPVHVPEVRNQPLTDHLANNPPDDTPPAVPVSPTPRTGDGSVAHPGVEVGQANGLVEQTGNGTAHVNSAEARSETGGVMGVGPAQPAAGAVRPEVSARADARTGTVDGTALNPKTSPTEHRTATPVAEKTTTPAKATGHENPPSGPEKAQTPATENPTPKPAAADKPAPVTKPATADGPPATHRPPGAEQPVAAGKPAGAGTGGHDNQPNHSDTSHPTPHTETSSGKKPEDWTHTEAHQAAVKERAEAEAAAVQTRDQAREDRANNQSTDDARRAYKDAEKERDRAETAYQRGSKGPRAQELKDHLEAANQKYHNASDALKTAKDADTAVQVAELAASAKRLSHLAAKLDYVLSRLTPAELRQLSEGKLDALKDLTEADARLLAIHELIHRTDRAEGWGFGLNWTQLHADAALRDGLLVEMKTGEGKTAVAVVTLGMIAAGEPVHFMTSSKSLAEQAHASFRKVLEPLGYDVIHVDPGVRYPKPHGRTVYVGDVAAFGWSTIRGHRVYGDHVLVDEIDAVAVDLAAQRYTHSAGSGRNASARTLAEVRRAKEAIEDGTFKESDFEQTSAGARLTDEARQRLADTESSTRSLKRQVRRLEAAAQAKYFLTEERHYFRQEIGGRETIVIISEHTGEPLIDRETLLEQRWTDVGQALEQLHGLEVRADPKHTNWVTTQELLGKYKSVRGMSGTARLAAQAMHDLYGERKVGEVAGIDRARPSRLEKYEPLTVETLQEKYQAVVDRVISDLAKDGDLSKGDPQLILVEHNDEVVALQKLLAKALEDLPGTVEIQIVDARELFKLGQEVQNLPKDQQDNAGLNRVLRQAGESGTITIGNKVMSRGIDIKPRTEGGLQTTVTYFDAQSPRTTEQAMSRSGRQGALGRAGLITSHEDTLFRQNSSALEASVAYHDAPSSAARKQAFDDYVTATIAHAKATALGQGAHTAPTVQAAAGALKIAETKLDPTAYNHAVETAQHAGQRAQVDKIRDIERQEIHEDDTARSRRLSDQPQPHPLDGVAYQRLSQAEQTEVRGIVHSLTAQDPVRLEGLRPLLESPWLRSLGPERLMEEIRGWEGQSYPDVFGKGVLFGIGMADAPTPVPLARPSRDLADAVDLGVHESLPEQLTGPDGADWAVKFSPDSESALAELDGLYGAYLTGFGPPPYGLVRATVGDRQYVGVGMAPVLGGPIVAAADAPAEAIAEAARRRSRVTFRTAQQLDVFGRSLIVSGYSLRRDLKYFVDEAGNFRPVDLTGVEELPADPSVRESRIADHFAIVAEHRRLLVEAAVANGPVPEETPAPVREAAPDPAVRELLSYKGLTAEQQDRIVAIVGRVTANDAVLLDGIRPLLESQLGPEELLAEIESWEGREYHEVFGRGSALGVEVARAPRLPAGRSTYPVRWDEATRLELEPAALKRLSSVGMTGSVASLGEYTGVFQIDRPDGRKWAVKLWPAQGFDRQIMREFAGQRAAELTGYAPELYGLVKATIDGQEYAGVAMEPVPGGFISTSSLDPAVVAEADRWRAAVDFTTVRQLDQYLQRLVDNGYDVQDELQFLVDDAGNVHPIDFEAVRRLSTNVVAPGEIGPFIARSTRNNLLTVAIENARRESERARLVEGVRAGMTVEGAERAVEDARKWLRLPGKIGVRFVVGADNQELVAKHGIEPADGARPGYFRMEDGVGVVYVSAADHLSAEDVRATIAHEVIGHYGWRLFSPADRAALLREVDVLARILAPEGYGEIKALYDDHHAEEFLARLIEGGLPRRFVNAVLVGPFGRFLHQRGWISDETLDRARRHHELEPLYRIARLLNRAVRRNRPVYDAAAAVARTRSGHPGPSIARIRPARMNKYDGGGLPAFTTGLVESSYDDLDDLDDPALAAVLQPGTVKRFLVTAADENHVEIEGARLTPHHLAVMIDLYRNVAVVLDGAPRDFAQKVASIMGVDLTIRTTDGWQVLHPKAEPPREGTVELRDGSYLVRTPAHPEGVQIEDVEPHLGRLLGIGGSKAAFAFYDKVVLIALPTVEVSFHTQLSRLEGLLEKPGATDVIAALHPTTVFGRDAFVADRFPRISRDVWVSVPDFAAPDALRPTRASLDSLLAIREFFVANNLTIGDLQFGIAGDGRFWVYDVGRVRPLGYDLPLGTDLDIFVKRNPLEVVDAWIAWAAAKHPFTPNGRPRRSPEPHADLQPPSYDWNTAGDHPAAQLYPDTPETRDRVVAELERAYVAARTGYGPVPIGLVTTELDGTPYVGFAVEPVDPAVHIEAVTLDTVYQLHEYVRRLHALGYYPAGELHGAVDANGTFHAIDSTEIQPLPGEAELAPFADQLLQAAFDNVKRAFGNQTGRDRRVHRDQPRGGAGSIHRSDFRGDGRRKPNPAAVWAAAEAALPEIANAVGSVHSDVRAIALDANRITISCWKAPDLTLELSVSGDFTNAGPVRWERTAQSMHWARITLSPQTGRDVVGRALTNAIAGIIAAHGGAQPDAHAEVARQAEVGYLVGRVERGESRYHFRKELRILLHHLGKTGGNLPLALQQRVAAVLRQKAQFKLDKLEDGWTDPAAFSPVLLPPLDTSQPFAPDPAVDRFVHGLFRHFAKQPEVSPEPGQSVSRLTVLREQPMLRQFVNWHGPAKAAELGRLDPSRFVAQINASDRQSVAAAFARLRGLLQQRETATTVVRRRTAARQFSELAHALGVATHDDLRSALPHDLAAAVADLKPSLLQRVNRSIDGGAKSMPGLRADLILGFLETVPAGTASAAVLAGYGRVGLAAAVLTGAVVLSPVRTLANRYVESREEQVKADRRTYRRALDEQAREPQRAVLGNAVRTAYHKVLAAAGVPSAQRPVPRADLTVPEKKAPALTTPWWSFPLRSSIPIAAAAIPMAFVVPPVVVGATVGLAVAVVGSTQYLFARHQAALDDERRTRDYEWRSWRQLVDEIRGTADHLMRLRALGNQLGEPGVTLPAFDFEAPTDHTGRGVVPAKWYFAGRELPLGAVPMAHRVTSVYLQQQLDTAPTAVLEALSRLGTIGAVSGLVEAFHAEANRNAFDRRMHNWLDLLRLSVQACTDEIGDPLLTRLDALLAEAPEDMVPVPVLPPWSPVLHPDREATTARRWYAVGAFAIGASGVGVASWMVASFDLNPLYFWQALAAGCVLPVSFYAKYLRRRMRVKADMAERDRGAEKRAADELDRERATVADTAHEVDRIEDAVAGRTPRTRPAPTSELTTFIALERREDRGSAELSRLLIKLEKLDADRHRLLQRYDELHELSDVLVAISTTLAQYADVLHKLGVDPHVRLAGPQDRPVSDSVLHHDPVHPRILSDRTWSGKATDAALIAAKIHLATDDRYGPFSLAQIQVHATTGKSLLDIAADVIFDAERRRGPARSADLRALKARVDFLRSLTADRARAVPARLVQQQQIPIDWPTYARMRIGAIRQQRTDLMDRADARTKSAAESKDKDKTARHTAIAEACTKAAVQGEQARQAWQAFRDHQTPAALARAQQAELLYEQRVAESLPSKDVLPTAIVSGDLPHLTALTKELNDALFQAGKEFRFTPELLRRTLRAETRRLLSPDGLILTVGNDPQADVSELVQFELFLDPNQLQEVLNHPVTFEEGQLGQIVQGGSNIGTTTTTTYGGNGALKFDAALSGLPDHNPVKAIATAAAPSVEYGKHTGLSVTGGATEYGLPGAVDVIQGEILRFRATRPRWSWRIRTSAIGAWSEQHVVAGQETLDLGISHAYTVGTPKDTVTIESDTRGTALPEHAASRVDGLSDLAEGAIAGLRQRLKKLDRIGHDQLRGMLLEDVPGRLAQTTRPGGLTRPITTGGRVVAYAQLETKVVREQTTMLGASSKDHKIERLRVGFSGTSGSQTRSAGDSYTISVGGTVAAWDFGLSAKVGVSTGSDVTVSTGDMAIHPSVQRVQPTVGVKLRLVHTLTIHVVRKRDSFTLTAEGDAVLRMPENDAFRYGLPVPAAAIVRGKDGRPRYGKDKRLLLRGDPVPQETEYKLPVWMQAIRGAGPALVQELTGADKVLKDFLDHLAGKGLIPDGRRNRELVASQLANLERVCEQLARHRLETGYDIAAQEGILFQLDLHRPGLLPEQHTYRIKIYPDAAKAEFLGLTDGQTVVNLDIGSNSTGKSGSWSHSLPWQFRGGLSNKATVGTTPDGGVTPGFTVLGRSVGWATGSTVNRVSLTESTAKVAVFDVPHRIVVTEVTDESTPIAADSGAARIAVDSEFCAGDLPPATAIPGEVDPLLLRSATFQAVDIGDPVGRLLQRLPQLARADSSALHHLSAFLNPRNLAARPELLLAPYRTGLLVTPVPSTPGQVVAQNRITAGRAKLTVSTTLWNLRYVGYGSPVNGEINLTLGSTALTTGTSNGGSVSGDFTDGMAEADGSSYGGTFSGKRSASRSASRTETQIGGIERLIIRNGRQYQFWADLAVIADLEEAGAKPQQVGVGAGGLMLTMPEPDVLRLYGRRKLDLPEQMVAEVIDRLRDGKLKLDQRTAVSVIHRYVREARPADVKPLIHLLTGGEPARLAEVFRRAKELAEQREQITVPAYYENTMGAAMIDSSSVRDPDGAESDLYREVLAVLDEDALEDPVLSAGLRGDLAGLRWHGHIDNLLSPSGFVTEYPTALGRPVKVRIRLRYKGGFTMDRPPAEEPDANATTILQVYNYRELSRSVARTTSYGGELDGALSPHKVGAGTELSTSSTASSTDQNTRITRALWDRTMRVTRGFELTVEVNDSTVRTLTGELTLLVPPSVINAEPTEADPRTVALPRGAVLGGTTANGLFETVHDRLGRPDMLTQAGVQLHRTTLENVLSAATRMAAFERIASPDGYVAVRLPVPGHRSRTVAVHVRAELSGMRLIVEDETQLGQIDREQHGTQTTTSSTHLLPAAGSYGTSNPGGVFGVGLTGGEQATEKVSDFTGGRNETSMYERGPVVTVQVDVKYHLTYTRVHPNRTGRPDTAVVPGTANLTMYRHEYEAMLQLGQAGLRPR
ncbi:hypothetical protein ACFV9C_41105 [Kribbella sp. NPDC059898]|uniref:WXG100-like domain-containing protein n=1 Tax=Kribbella sp. NPDC059898 TaxID=3346995 RepID=UPI00365EC3CB